jgi:hypothetical protein
MAGESGFARPAPSGDDPADYARFDMPEYRLNTAISAKSKKKAPI